jgi:1,4-alpha-glucan branching enzyme
MMGHPGKKLLFMGSEFAQTREWHHDRSLDWHLLDDPAHAGMQRYVRQINAFLQTEPALFETDYDGSGFRWIDCSDNENSVVALMRSAREPQDFVLMVFNFTPVPRAEYRIGVPAPGFYHELMNSDAAIYGGSNMGNGGGRESEPVGAHGFAHSLRLTLPPLSCLLLKVR